MTNEERLSGLKQKVSDLKTNLAIEEDQKKRSLKDLKEYDITNVTEAEAELESTTKKIDEKETLRDQELDKAESYLEQYNV